MVFRDRWDYLVFIGMSVMISFVISSGSVPLFRLFFCITVGAMHRNSKLHQKSRIHAVFVVIAFITFHCASLLDLSYHCSVLLF